MGIQINPFTGQLDITGGGSAVTIGGPVVGSDPNSVLIVDSSSNLADVPLADGELVIGATGATPAAGTLTGTTNQVYVTNGPNSITLSLPQSIDSTASPSFANIVLSPSGSLDITGAGGTLAIGTANADIINIGNSGATINIQGDTFYQNVTDLVVTDKTITINSGGSAGSGSNAGLQVEENAIITAYIDTSADRNSWELKAPAQTGIATISPGASGFTIDQGSHDPVTIGTANGLSLSTQAISLALASTSTTGALSSTDWNTFNGKEVPLTFSTGLTRTANTITVNTSQNISTLSNLTTNGFVKTTGGTGALSIDTNVYITGNQNITLSGDISGSGTTAISTTLATVNSDVGSFTNASITVNAKGLITAASSGIVSSVFLDGAFLIENSSDTTKQLAFNLSSIGTTTTRSIVMPDLDVNLGSLTDSNISASANIAGTKILAGVADSAVVTDVNGTLTTTSTTATQIGYLNTVTSDVQVQLNGKQSAITGDISPTTWTGIANNTANQVITGFVFANSVKSFEALVDIEIVATSNVFTTVKLIAKNKSTNWSASAISTDVIGDIPTGITFNVNSSGNVTISTGSIAGFASGTVKFRAITLS